MFDAAVGGEPVGPEVERFQRRVFFEQAGSGVDERFDVMPVTASSSASRFAKCRYMVP